MTFVNCADGVQIDSCEEAVELGLLELRLGVNWDKREATFPRPGPGTVLSELKRLSL
jgi:hypothetical protein